LGRSGPLGLQGDGWTVTILSRQAAEIFHRESSGLREGAATSRSGPRFLWSRTQGLGTDHLFTVAARDSTVALHRAKDRLGRFYPAPRPAIRWLRSVDLLQITPRFPGDLGPLGNALRTIGPSLAAE
jgi:hypothetical protein